MKKHYFDILLSLGIITTVLLLIGIVCSMQTLTIVSALGCIAVNATITIDIAIKLLKDKCKK